MASEAVPDYPFWQASAPEAVFGADGKRYLSISKTEAGALARTLRDEAAVFSALFFRGGSLAQHGLRWNPELAEQDPFQTLRALMGSFQPSHEVKEATVALALHHWCERIPADTPVSL